MHAIGTGATELIHIGQAVLALGGGLDYFLETVFNYPTLAECYKVAALNAGNKMGNLDLGTQTPLRSEPPGNPGRPSKARGGAVYDPPRSDLLFCGHFTPGGSNEKVADPRRADRVCSPAPPSGRNSRAR